MRVLLLLACGVACGVTCHAEVWTFWVQPCDSEAARDTECKGSDPELAHWALDDWAKQSSGKLSFRQVDAESEGRLRFRWAGGRSGLYGETRAFDFQGKLGATVYVLPRLDALGPDVAEDAKDDGLLRETIVYLTCLHESGHALGLPHTDGFDDIMYSFQFGGDIKEYFVRYRRKLHGRDDIRDASALSAHDLQALKETLR